MTQLMFIGIRKTVDHISLDGSNFTKILSYWYQLGDQIVSEQSLFLWKIVL